MISMHEKLRLRQDVWDRLGDTYAATLVRDGLRLAWWSGPPTGRLTTSQPSPVTEDATKLVTRLLLQGAIMPCGEEDLWGVSALIMVCRVAPLLGPSPPDPSPCSRFVPPNRPTEGLGRRPCPAALVVFFRPPTSSQDSIAERSPPEGKRALGREQQNRITTVSH